MEKIAGVWDTGEMQNSGVRDTCEMQNAGHKQVVFWLFIVFSNLEPLLQPLKQQSIKKQRESIIYYTNTFDSRMHPLKVLITPQKYFFKFQMALGNIERTRKDCLAKKKIPKNLMLQSL